MPHRLQPKDAQVGFSNAIQDQKEYDMELLVGNAMSIPVIGVVAGCALSMLE